MQPNKTSEHALKQQLIDEHPIRPFQWLIFAIALLINLIDGYDITTMAYSAHEIGIQLELTEDKLGILFSAALAGMMLGATLLAPFCDTYGRRITIIVGLGIIGISLLLTALCTSLIPMVILRLVAGLGVGVIIASVTVLVSEYTPSAYTSLAVVTIVAGYPAGASLGGFIAAPLLEVYGWQAIFIAGGVMTLLLMLLAFFFIPESLDFLLSNNRADSLQKLNHLMKKFKSPPLSEIPSQPKQATTALQPVQAVKDLMSPEYRNITLRLWITFFFGFVCLYFVLSWLPKLVINAGLEDTVGIYAVMAYNGGGVIGILTLGFFTKRISLSVLIATFFIVGAIGMALLDVFINPEMFLYYLMALGFLSLGGFTGLYAIAAKLYPASIRATGLGWAIGLGRFGAVIGPYIGGVLIASSVSMQWNFILFGLSLGIGGLFAYTLKVR